MSTESPKTLVLMDTLYNMYMLKGEPHNNILFKPLMKKSRKKDYIYRLIRKIHLSSCIGKKEIWFADWVQYVNDYDTIVLGETGNTYNVAKYIKKKYPNKRVIIWYRNSISHSVSPLKFKNSICEIWSFDKEDCDKYNIKYNPQFYIYNPQYAAKEYEYDAFFIGKDKGRLEKILKLEELLKTKGLRTKFCIVGYNSSYLSYSEILDYISKSKAIIDIQGDWQNGITLRPLEALFYNKKLITNSIEVLNSDYYHPNNIYILEQEERDIQEFMESNIYITPRSIINKYNLESWVNRFYY